VASSFMLNSTAAFMVGAEEGTGRVRLNLYFPPTFVGQSKP